MEWFFKHNVLFYQPIARFTSFLFVTVFFTVTLIATHHALADTPVIASDSRAIVSSAAEIDYPPFSFVSQNGEVDGFSVELMRAALSAMGHDVSFRIGPWEEVRGWLERGEIDALPLVGRTPEREALFDFTVPYMSLHGAIVVRGDETGIRDLSDLRGRQVAVMKGDNAEEFLRRETRDIAIQTTASYEIALQGLAESRYDAVVVQRLVALRLIEKTGLTDLQIIDQPIEGFKQDFCFAVHEGDREKLALLNEGLAIVVADGTYRHLHAKWFAAMQLPTNRPLVVGGDLNFPPFEFLDENGRPAGYNVDLTRAIAQAMGLNVEIRLGRWPERMEALKHGKIDMLQGMFYSPARDLTFDFSQAHTISHYVAVVRKGEGPAPESVESLKDKRIVVQRGDIVHDFLLEQGLEKQLTLVDEQEAVLRELSVDGSFDCAVVSRVAALHLIEKYGWTNIALGKKPLLSSEYSYAAAEGQKALLSQFSEGLQVLERSGEYRRIYDKWLGVYQERPVSFLSTLRYSAMVIVPLLLILLIAFTWSWALRRQVSKKTSELRTSEEYQRAMITCSPVALYTVDMDGKVINWNHSAERTFGWCAEEILGKPLPIVPADKEQEFDALRRQVLEHGEFFGKELMRVKKDGTVFPVSLSVAPVRNDRGEIVGILGAAEDLTERKASENQLEWNLRRNGLLSDTAARLLQSDDPQALVEDLCRRVMEFIDCQAFFNFLEDSQKGELHLNAYAGIPEQEAKKIEWLEHGVAVCGCVAQDRLPMLCENILNRGDDPLTDLVKSYGIQAFCRHPLMIQERLIGTLSFGRRSAPCFEKREIDLMASVADLVAIAMNRIDSDHKLRDSESRFRMFAELAPLGIVISDEKENTLYVNPRFTELFGYTIEDMPSVQQWWELAYPDASLRNSIKEEWHKAVEQARGTYSEIMPREYPVRCQDGTVRHIEFRVATTGNLNVVVFTDATERKQTEAQREEFARIFEDSVNEVYVFDANTLLIVQANQAALNNTGYSLDELQSMSPMDLKPYYNKDDFHTFLDILRKTEKDKVVFETTHQRKNGTLYHVEVHLQLHRFKSHERFVAVSLDISERKNAEEENKRLGSQLHQAQKMESIGRLAGGVAHDYNNMLGVIIGYTEMALDKLYEDDPLHKDLTEVRKAAERSADITKQLLAFSRQQTITPKVLDLNQGVTNLKGMLRRLLGEDIQFRWQPGEDLWPIYMDPVQFDQILMNLCVNARDAISDVGTISIETYKTSVDDEYCQNHYGFLPGEFTALSVTDNGSGMDRETRDKLFEPFFTTKKLGKGTGLGLATVYGILQQNNCFINVYSEPGQGSTFTIYFPRHHEAEQPTDLQPAPAHANRRGHETILLLEDEEAILKMTTLMLTELGYSVIACNTPGEAVEKAAQQRVHLLITDVVMPEMNGRELSERLKQTYPDLKTLFMSGYTANIIAHRGVLDKGINFIQKPFTMKDLGHKVRDELDRKHTTAVSVT